MKIDHTNVVRVYSGKSGCMCGCNGSYREEERSKKNMLTRILKSDYNIDVWKMDSDGIAGCLWNDDGRRTQAVYFGAGVKLFEDVDAATLKEERDGEMVTRVNMMSGLEYQERRDTPIYCSPASETYWSM
jgi:hypothetical protein